MSAAAGRDLRLDALRALALAGILQINIQSFVWGAGNPLGYFRGPPSAAEAGTYFLLSALVEYKFMPLFALLFGASFGLLWHKLESTRADARRVMRRRYAFLFAFGVAHGLLAYYGDITNLYALLGLLLMRHIDSDVATLARAVRRWWIAAGGVTVVLATLAWIAASPDDAEFSAELAQAYLTYTRGSWAEQLPQRAQDFVLISWSAWLGGLWVPVHAFMLTGLLAMRAGWLATPPPGLARRALVLGLFVGLPAGLLHAAGSLAAVSEGPGTLANPLLAIPLLASSTLAFAYSALVLWFARGAWIAWLAPAGRMPLTNYLAQSLAMGALLSGWGLGWGAWMNTWQLAVLGIAIVIVQWLVSRWWMARHAHGPLEALWRRAAEGPPAVR
jgi:uncharacterized protein